MNASFPETGLDFSLKSATSLRNGTPALHCPALPVTARRARLCAMQWKSLALPVLYFLGLLCVYTVYIDTCNGPCVLSCMEKWHTQMYINIIIIIIIIIGEDTLTDL